MGAPVVLRLDEDLRRVAEFRAAARAVLRDDGLSVPDRGAALVGLYRRAKAEPLAGFAVGAIVAEIGWEHDRPYVRAQRDAGDPLERRHRAMRAEGCDCCPRCLTRLSSGSDWSRWAALREDALREIAAREGAVQ